MKFATDECFKQGSTVRSHAKNLLRWPLLMATFTTMKKDLLKKDCQSAMVSRKVNWKRFRKIRRMLNSDAQKMIRRSSINSMIWFTWWALTIRCHVEEQIFANYLPSSLAINAEVAGRWVESIGWTSKTASLTMRPWSAWKWCCSFG